MAKKSHSDIGESTRSYEKWLGSRIRLIPEDLRRKHSEMKKALFPFMRATFYRWAEVWPQVCGDLASAPEALFFAWPSKLLLVGRLPGFWMEQGAGQANLIRKSLNSRRISLISQPTDPIDDVHQIHIE